jgi:uncharacterized repeat protein (TIGR01451 family)
VFFIASDLLAPPKAGVDLVIDGDGDGVYGAPGTGAGGSSIVTSRKPAGIDFVIEIQNEGGNAGAFTLSWNSLPGWIATVDGNNSPYTTGNIATKKSDWFNFHVDVPATAPPGEYVYIIDVVALRDTNEVESVEARITVQETPRVDLVIDGNGLGLFGTLWTGDGGTSLRAANAGSLYTSTLDVWNVGDLADSFYVQWDVPPGWPAGSVVISDGATDFTTPFWTPVISGGMFQGYSVEVQVPPGVAGGFYSAIINSYSSQIPNLPESVRLTTQTAAVVTGVVFEDRDQDGALSPGDPGLPGVVVREENTGQNQITNGSGGYTFLITGGTSAIVTEQNPFGFLSLSPDTVGTIPLDAGDTLRVDFADVAPLRLSPGVVLNGIAGSYVDFPHRLDASTRGQVVLGVRADSSVVTAIYLDENANGVFDGADRPLQPADLYMDPVAGDSTVSILLRAFVPDTYAPGTTFRLDVDASQLIEGTSLVTIAQATDAVVVVANPIGRITLQKQVDLGAARPGDVLTYSISFFNVGVDSVQNIVIVDPISPFVDPVPDAFGPGLDVEWQRQGSGPQYLTLDPVDGDECEYTTVDRLLTLLFSKTTPYFLEPGEQGTLTYKVLVK